MAEGGIGDFFISDADDDLIDEDDDFITAPVVVPINPTVATPQPTPAVAPPVAAPVQQPAPAPVAVPTAAPVVEQPAPASARPATAAARPAGRPAAQVRQATREERLAESLNALMEESQDIQAAALVSMDGFTMASALPPGMQEDRVGAMSAAILGLGERAAAELGRGSLTQVFIEGDGGYVVLIAAGDRAVLTALADIEAKLGLVLYDMRQTAEEITEILG